MPLVLEHLKKPTPYYTGLTLSLRGKFNRGAISYTQAAPDMPFKNYQPNSGGYLALIYRSFNLISDVKKIKSNNGIK